jgi:Putative metal-binding motif/Arylsulfotransferase (ASST)
VLPNGHITVYNNGNFNLPQVSACQEYVLNETTMTATLVWEYQHPDGLFAPSMGGCRRLANGNTFINWGNVLNDSWGARVSEVRPNGFVDLEYAFPTGLNAYRSYKSEWFFSETVVGCTDPNAINFNPDAPILNDMYCDYDEDLDGVTLGDGDCNDDNESIYPGAEEIPNDGIDQDCVDGDLVLTDADDDGYFDEVDDCDDADNSAYPGAPEIANDGIDQDCDGFDLVLKDLDVDDDGFDYSIDCDDNNDQVYPGAVEIPYDGIDQDCSDGDLTDVDGDGIAGPDDDCDDNNEGIFPGAEEIPYDGIDQDCSGGDLTDIDGDGVSGPDEDCDDNNNGVYPGADEIPYDGIDQDCADGDLTDVDGDGVSGPDDDCNDEDNGIYPGANEIANDGIDQDCVGGDLIISVEEALENVIRLSPQPASDYIHIQSPIEISFDVVDATGRLMHRAQQVYVTVVDCNTWTGGVYLLHITDGANRSAVMKVVVE